MVSDESHFSVSVLVTVKVTRQCLQTTIFEEREEAKVEWSQGPFAAASLSPFLTGRMFVCPNILRTLRRTMIRFLIEHLVRRIWFGQSRLYFILNWLVMRCKLRPELAADAQQTA